MTGVDPYAPPTSAPDPVFDRSAHDARTGTRANRRQRLTALAGDVLVVTPIVLIVIAGADLWSAQRIGPWVDMPCLIILGSAFIVMKLILFGYAGTTCGQRLMGIGVRLQQARAEPVGMLDLRAMFPYLLWSVPVAYLFFITVGMVIDITHNGQGGLLARLNMDLHRLATRYALEFFPYLGVAVMWRLVDVCVMLVRRDRRSLDDLCGRCVVVMLRTEMPAVR